MIPALDARLDHPGADRPRGGGARGLFVRGAARPPSPCCRSRLFRQPNLFVTTSGVGLIVGFALFGSVTYLPLFLQVVNERESATASGLQMLPTDGRDAADLHRVQRPAHQPLTGRYKTFSDSSAVAASWPCGLFLLSRMTAATTGGRLRQARHAGASWEWGSAW